MKGHSLHRRVRYAWQGWLAAARHEASFRMQLLGALFAIVALLVIRPSPVWVALIVVMIALVLAAELFNTALESALDGLHPESAEFVRLAKDCAAGAVLVLSCGAVLVFVLMLVDTFQLSLF